MKLGRPTKYDPKFCEMAIKLMREGASLEEVAYEFYVDRDTIKEWRKVHPDFSAAIEQGKSFSKGWWLKVGRKNLGTKEFNSSLYFMNMKNRHDWSDKREIREESNQTITYKETEEILEIKKSFEKEV